MSVAKSSFLFSLGTLFSRFTGLLRDTILAGIFGASTFLDAFLIANRIPNLLRDLLAEGALGSAFTKVFSSLYVDDPKRAEKLFIDMIKIAFWITAFLCLLGILTAPWLVEAITFLSEGSGRTEEFYTNTIALTRILFPTLGISVLGAIVMGALHQRGQFFLSAISPIALNGGYIIGALVFATYLNNHTPQFIERLSLNPGILGLSIGVLLGALTQFLVMFSGVWKDLVKGRKFHFFKLSWSPDVTNVVLLMIPAAIAASAGSINVFVNTNFAASLDTGAVSWLNFAFRLVQLPVGLFGVAVGVTVLPALSRSITKAGRKVDDIASKEFQNACDLILWCMIPCLVILLYNSLPIVQLIYQHGKFGESSAQFTAETLFAYSFCIIAYGLIKVLTSFYYAVERTSYAMKVSLFSIAVNLLANILLVKRFGHIGLATATSVTLSMNAIMLFLGLLKENLNWDLARIFRSFGLLLTGVAVSLLCQWGFSQFIHFDFGLLKLNAFLEITVNSIIVGVIFAILVMLYLRKSPRDFIVMLNTFLLKFKSKKN